MRNQLLQIRKTTRPSKVASTRSKMETHKILAGYNAGENAVINSGYKVPPYRETRSYVARGVSVLRRIAQSNILSLEPGLQVHTPHVKQAVSSANGSALPYRPA